MNQSAVSTNPTPTLALNHHVLDVDGQPVSLGEVFASARIGRWRDSEMAKLRDKLACTALAEHEDSVIDIQDLQKAIDNWRRERDLSAADETESMLSTYAVTLNDLVAYMRRNLYLELYKNRIQEAHKRFPVSKLAVERLLPVDVIFNAVPTILFDDFALRAVAQTPSPEAASFERARLLKASGLPNEHWPALLKNIYGISQARSSWLLEVEIAFRLQRQILVNDATLTEEFQRNPIDLTRLEIALTEVVDKDVAQELLCCIRADNETLAQAAAHANLRCRNVTWFFSDLDALPFGVHLPAARPGEAYGPAVVGEHYLVIQVAARHNADPADPATRARLEQQIIERALRKQAAQRVITTYSSPLR